MGDKKPKVAEPEMTAEGGIKVALGGLPGNQWIEFLAEGWNMATELKFAKANDFTSFQMIVERARDWSVLDVNGAIVPFDQAYLLDALSRIAGGETDVSL